MQPESPRDLSPGLRVSDHPANLSTHQHGSNDEESVTQSPSGREEDASAPESGSEWSLSESTSPGQGPSSDDDTWLKLAGVDFKSLRLDSGHALRIQDIDIHDSVSNKTTKRDLTPSSVFNRLPEEVLFHVFSHLSASDLLLMKLVSRRFHNLVTSPLAWINAFSNYFPGQNLLRGTTDVVPGDGTDHSRKAVAVVFARLTAAASWTGEYVLRAKLLRCLARGRPSIPFAVPSPGKAHKGYATFTFSARGLYYVDRLNGQFGDAGDKRLPLFIHGLSDDGTISCSDKRGEFHGWGQKERRMFRNADTQYPGATKWGLGSGDFVIVPNVMDVSSRFGMVVGEGVPGGNVYYLAGDEKHGRFLAPHPEAVQRGLGDGLITPPHMQSITAAWIAKSPTIPRLTRGLIGILSGSSSGIVSAYSLGISVNQGLHHERGELVARWILSPGIPIISIQVDEDYSTSRFEQQRIWAVALNALGEIFHLSDFPVRAALDRRQHDPDIFDELRAWTTANSAMWNLVGPSQKQVFSTDDRTSSHFSEKVHPPGNRAGSDDLKNLLKKSPSEVRALYTGWDMRRYLEVDFGGCNDSFAGEGIVVISCGHDEKTPAVVTRYVRLTMLLDETSMLEKPYGSTNVSQESVYAANTSGDSNDRKFRWHLTNFSLPPSKNETISAVALDMSKFAVTTYTEDTALYYTRMTEIESSRIDAGQSQLRTMPIPGQRARLIAVGTKMGRVYMWNARAPVSQFNDLINEVEPCRIIQTDSPVITSLAATSLFVVHGGSDGCVQAWDPLASTDEPIRTIFSKFKNFQLWTNRITSSDSTAVQERMRKCDAANAIYLDPDPRLLRGIVAVGNQLRYWSFSSSAAGEASSKSHRRRLNKAARLIRAGQTEGMSSARRIGLKLVVDEEIESRRLDAKEKKAEEKEYKKFANRFGTELLGEGASEEELIAYAKLLSEEEQTQRETQSGVKKLRRDATDAEVIAHVNSLNPEEYERWRFASWEERFEIPASSTPRAFHDASPSMPSFARTRSQDEVARAIQNSLEDVKSTPSASATPLATQDSTKDDDIAEAIRRSLAEAQHQQLPKSNPDSHAADDGEDEIEKAIRLSLQESGSARAEMPTSPPWSPSSTGQSSTNISYEEEFPTLGSSPASSPPLKGSRNSKGKDRVW